MALNLMEVITFSSFIRVALFFSSLNLILTEISLIDLFNSFYHFMDYF
jgi:hypothetical protein